MLAYSSSKIGLCPISFVGEAAALIPGSTPTKASPFLEDQRWMKTGKYSATFLLIHIIQESEGFICFPHCGNRHVSADFLFYFGSYAPHVHHHQPNRVSKQVKAAGTVYKIHRTSYILELTRGHITLIRFSWFKPKSIYIRLVTK